MKKQIKAIFLTFMDFLKGWYEMLVETNKFIEKKYKKNLREQNRGKVQ